MEATFTIHVHFEVETVDAALSGASLAYRLVPSFHRLLFIEAREHVHGAERDVHRTGS